jgi:hypothetical protein
MATQAAPGPGIEGEIDRHCAEIERCNQRGGRMLSVVNLLEAGTLSGALAAYALAAIWNGCSFLVGARPGGAGKTTVMGALLNFVPPTVTLAAADGEETISHGLKSPIPRRCYICHEIGNAGYFSYLWGADLRAYFHLPEAGHMLATNLHADTYEQCREQICIVNRVSVPALQHVNIMFFLLVHPEGKGWVRRIDERWESDGKSSHRPIYKSGCFIAQSQLVSQALLMRASAAINALIRTGARSIWDVRHRLLTMGW